MAQPIPVQDFSPEHRQFVYDGSCPFCTCWASRLHRWLSFPGSFVPYKEHIHYRFTQVDSEDFQIGVMLWDPDKGALQGGEAVIELLRASNRLNWLIKLYDKFSLFKKTIDSSYKFVSKHRPFFIELTLCQYYKDKVES